MTCECGQQHNIPLLSELRKMAGHAAYSTSAVDEINRMIGNGELPWGTTCAISDRRTLETYTFHVQYEFSWHKGSDDSDNLFLYFLSILLPFGSLLRLASFHNKQQEFGRDRIISVPLRVCDRYHKQLNRTRSQRKLRQLLSTVPIYAKLFKEYPKSRIST